jgi:hypothetical protein
MKKLLLSVVVSLTCAGGVFAQLGTWIPQATGFPNQSTGVFNVSVVDSNVVWISSYDGSGAAQDYQDYSVTIDGGATWIPGVVPAPATYGWSMIFGLDATTAWAMFYDAAAGSGGGIWKTTDGGVSWNQQGVGTIFNATSFPNVVHFWNANDGFAMGDPNPSGYEIYTTTDGGTTWVPVPSANIPAPLAGEFGIVNHYDVIGDTVWFDTNKGRVYRSVDKGLNWTVASTGITVPANGAMDIAFWDGSNGIARVYNNTTGVNTAVRTTSDGGLTWTAATVTGNFFGSDVDNVPGSSRLVSTGAAPGFVGSSYSDDGGLTWIDIETGAQRTALGIWDANTMWAGGFTVDPFTDGIFKFAPLTIIACGDPLISSGVSSAPDSTICFGDTLFFETSGAFPPTAASTFGWSIIVSTQDISNNPDPLNQPVGVILGGTGAVFPVPDPIATTLPNNGLIFQPGTYYFTPVVYANANTTGSTNIADFTLDPNCTYTGTSVEITLYQPGDPACATGLVESFSGVSFTAFQSTADEMSLNISSDKQHNLQVALFDLAGRMVQSGEVRVSAGQNSQQMDISGLSAGTYVVRLSDGNGAATAKFFRY